MPDNQKEARFRAWVEEYGRLSAGVLGENLDHGNCSE